MIKIFKVFLTIVVVYSLVEISSSTLSTVIFAQPQFADSDGGDPTPLPPDPPPPPPPD